MKQLVNFGYKVSLWMTFVLGVILLCMSGGCIVAYRKLYDGSFGEAVSILAVLALAVVLAFLALKLYGYIEHTGRRITVALFVSIVLLQIIFLALVSRPMAISDAARVQEEALAMARVQNGQMNLENTYFQRYTNNHFITVVFYYFFLLLKACQIEQIWLPLVILNTCFVDVGIYISFRIAKRLKGRGMANMLLLCFLLCPTTYVWLTTAYTNTMSFPFVVGILYLCLWLRGGELTVKNIVKCILLGIFMAIGYKLRPTTILPIIAMVLFAAVKFFQAPFFLENESQDGRGEEGKRRLNPQWRVMGKKNGKRNTIVKAGLVLIVFGLVFVGCNTLVAKHVNQKQLTGAFPITHWIMMGLNEESMGGFSREDEAYTMGFSTKQEKTQANLEETKHRLCQMGPVGVVKQLFVKIFRVWAMGDDDSLPKAGYAKEYPLLYEYVMGNNNGCFLLYTQAYRVCTFFFLCMALLRELRRKTCSELFLFILTFLGAVLFFALWEANRKYNICFVGVYLLLMTDGIQYAGVLWDTIRFKGPYGGKYKAFLLVILLCVVTVVITQGNLLRKERHRQKKHFYQSRIVGDSVSVEEELQETPYLIEQTLQQNQYTGKGQWNELRLYFAVNTSVVLPTEDEYQIELLKYDEKEVLYKQRIGLGDLDGQGTFTVKPERMGGKTANGYVLRLTYIGKRGINMVPKVNRFPDFDAYPYGEMQINGRKTKYDLSMGLQQKNHVSLHNR